MSTFLERACIAATIYGIEVLRDDIVVLTDDPPVSFANTDNAAVIAVMVASRSAVGLMQHARIGSMANDAFAQAARWAESQRGQLMAPVASPARIREIVAMAEAAGRVLVEPELPSAWRSLRLARLPVDRAITSILVRGAIARPLLFVHAKKAPKNGLAKLREERILDASFLCLDRDALSNTLSPLRDATAPMHGKELLRAMRALQKSASASDGPLLAKELTLAWQAGVIDATI